jgi:hypothetical protein
MEIRPLPPAHRIKADYDQWVDSDPSQKCRLYKATLCGATNQLNFSVQIGEADTPFGRSDVTTASFLYRDPTNGDYILEWELPGRYSTTFLRLDEKPKDVVLELIAVSRRTSVPRLLIVGVGGIESHRTVVAMVGHKAPVVDSHPEETVLGDLNRKR